MRTHRGTGIMVLVGALGLGGVLTGGAALAGAGTAAASVAHSHSGATPGAGSSRPAAKLVQTGAWRIQQQPNSYTWNFAGSSCAPGTTTCWLTGGTFSSIARVFKSTDGGATWTSQSAAVPVVQGGLPAVSCPTSTVCFAGGGMNDPTAGKTHPGMVATTDGGATWVSETVPVISPTNRVAVRGLSCASTTRCVGVTDYGGIIVTTDGVNWGTQTSGTTENLYSVSCLDTTHCFAVGGAGTILATTDGSTWNPQTSGTGHRSDVGLVPRHHPLLRGGFHRHDPGHHRRVDLESPDVGHLRRAPRGLVP